MDYEIDLKTDDDGSESNFLPGTENTLKLSTHLT